MPTQVELNGEAGGREAAVVRQGQGGRARQQLSSIWRREGASEWRTERSGGATRGDRRWRSRGCEGCPCSSAMCGIARIRSRSECALTRSSPTFGRASRTNGWVPWCGSDWLIACYGLWLFFCGDAAAVDWLVAVLEYFWRRWESWNGTLGRFRGRGSACVWEGSYGGYARVLNRNGVCVSVEGLCSLCCSIMDKRILRLRAWWFGK